MAAHQVQRAVESGGGIVLLQRFQFLREIRCVKPAKQKVVRGAAEGIVHRAVEFRPEKIAAQLSVADLVGGVFPDFSHQKAVRSQRTETVPSLP